MKKNEAVKMVELIVMAVDYDIYKELFIGDDIDLEDKEDMMSGLLRIVGEYAGIED